MGDGLDHQLKMNQSTWSKLTELGVRPGDALSIDAFFVAAREESAGLLATALTDSGWESEASSSRAGFLRRRTVWNVQASKRVSDVDLSTLDALVKELDALADEHQAEFDGWGTELPSEGN